MQTPRLTRSSVLGKRSHQTESSPVASEFSSDIPTPEQSPNPKRAKTLGTTLTDADGNKENVPPLLLQSVSTPRATRALRRTSTEMTTPSRPRATPRRHASMSNLSSLPGTPASTFSQMAISTPPSSPPSFLPLHSRARALLRATCDSTGQIAGRVEQRAAIQDFISAFLGAVVVVEGPSTLYISGSPGTGKTALVNSILRNMEVATLSGVRLVSINCMALERIDDLYDRLAGELAGAMQHKSLAKGKKLMGRESVEYWLANAESKCVLVLDELDHLATSSQALTSIFALAQSHPTSLRIIGIANTHTLTSSTSQLSTLGVTSVKTLHFSPYTSSQLLEILRARLGPLTEDTEEASSALAKRFLPPPTLTLLAQKIAAQTGDVRCLFEVLRGAIDIAMALASSKETNPFDVSPTTVTPSHILAALKAYTVTSTSGRLSMVSASSSGSCNGVTVATIRALGLQARLALLSMVLASKRLETGLQLSGAPQSSKPAIKRARFSSAISFTATSGVEIGHLHAYYSTILTRGENRTFSPVQRSGFADLIGLLDTHGLLSLSSPSGASPSKGGRRSLSRSTSFGMGGVKGAAPQEVKLSEGVRVEEVLRGLGISNGAAGGGEVLAEAMVEQVQGIWERERARISREVKSNSPIATVDVFGDAMED